MSKLPQRPDERRKHLLEYLHLSIEDLARRGIVKKTDTFDTIAKTLLSTLGLEILSDAKVAAVRYLREKGGQAISDVVGPTLGRVVEDPALGEFLQAGLKWAAGALLGGEKAK